MKIKLFPLQSPSGEFDRLVAGYIEEGGDGFAPSTSSGSIRTSSETRETFSPGSLALSPSMSCNSSTDWNTDDDFLMNCGASTQTTDDALIDPGNWNFETFDEDSIDLNFFQNWLIFPFKFHLACSVTVFCHSLVDQGISSLSLYFSQMSPKNLSLFSLWYLPYCFLTSFVYLYNRFPSITIPQSNIYFCKIILILSSRCIIKYCLFLLLEI